MREQRADSLVLIDVGLPLASVQSPLNPPGLSSSSALFFPETRTASVKSVVNFSTLYLAFDID